MLLQYGKSRKQTGDGRYWSRCNWSFCSLGTKCNNVNYRKSDQEADQEGQDQEGQIKRRSRGDQERSRGTGSVDSLYTKN